jgi:hypothetical protein
MDYLRHAHSSPRFAVYRSSRPRRPLVCPLAP